jgi:5-formyltetrahydrofolate cyclo-ligase
MSSAANSSEADGDIRYQKQLLRKSTRALLKEVSNEDIARQSAAVWDRLHALPLYQAARSIGLFLSMPAGEIHTTPALAWAIQQDKDIYIPQVGSNFELADMELIQIDTLSSSGDEPIYAKWPRNKWGIPEPPQDVILKAAQPGDIDLLIVPGLAFDRQGNRLGQGKGYYDRFMARMCRDPLQKAPALIAVGLQCQLVEPSGSHTLSSIPVHEHDFAVDWVLLPNETIQVQK